MQDNILMTLAMIFAGTLTGPVLGWYLGTWLWHLRDRIAPFPRRSPNWYISLSGPWPLDYALPAAALGLLLGPMLGYVIAATLGWAR